MIEKKTRHYYMNAAEVMDTIIDIFKKSFFIQIGYSIITSIISMIFMFLLALSGAIALLSYGIGSGFNSMGPAEAIVIILLILFFASIYGSVAVSLRSTGNILISMNAFKGEKNNLDKIIFQAIKKIPAVATVIIAEFILLIPFLLVIGIGFFFYILIIEIMNPIELTTVGASIAIVLLILGLLIFTVAVLAVYFTVVSLAVPISIFEKKYFFSAIYKSFLMVKKDFFKILALIIIWQFTVSAFSYGITAFTGLARTLASIFLPARQAMTVGMATSSANYLISSVISMAFAPLGGIFTTILYINRKIKCEGYDITMYLENK